MAQPSPAQSCCLLWHSKARTVGFGTAWRVPPPRAGQGHTQGESGDARGTLCAPSPAVPTLSQRRDTPATAALRPRASATQGATFCGNKGTLCTALGATRLHRPGSPAPSHGSGAPVPPRSPASLGLCSVSASGNEHNTRTPKNPENPNLGAAAGDPPNYGQRTRNTLCAKN